MSRTAHLTGTYRQPVLRLRFERKARLKDGTSLVEWVKALPRRRWNAEERAWDVTGTGDRPSRLLKRAGFELDLEAENDDPSLQDVWDIDELVDPLLRLSKQNPAIVLVRPRLAGFELARRRLGPGARWDRDTGRFEMPVADVLTADGRPKPGLVIPKKAIAAAKEARSRGVRVTNAAELAGAKSVDEAGKAALATIAKVGDVPDWFGVQLYPYQRAGAIAAVSGHRLIADEPGLGKTLEALGAVAMTDADRLLIISPPVAMTHWAREIAASRVVNRPTRGNLSEPVDNIVVISPTRKVPDLPGVGAVVVSDSLLASRPALVEQIRAWKPDALIVDEIHREKTWESARSVAVRSIAEQVPGIRLGISGTPMFANPVELASPLAITGQLDPVFGGYGAFVETYARQNHFKAWVARKKMLPQLRRIFDEQVWVRRRKDDVIDLPPKTRRELVVDVDLSGFRKAHKEVTAKVAQWVEDYVAAEGHLPDDETIEAFARQSIGLTSMLRRAAGLAKVKAATDYIAEWVEQTKKARDEEGHVTFDRPLIVWTHHRVVSEAMAQAVPQAVGGARVIIGGISREERTEIVDEFQAGRIPVVVASITAAGTGITLTRASDALFVETDWTPALVQQAEDRCHRVGSQRPVTLTTMVAPGTLDERVQSVLTQKAELLEVLMGQGQDVSVSDFEDDEATAPAEIVAEIARDIIAKRAKGSRRRKAA